MPQQSGYIISRSVQAQRAHLVKAVSEDGQGLVAQEGDQGGQVLQLLVRADANAQAPDRAHPVLHAPFKLVSPPPSSMSAEGYPL